MPAGKCNYIVLYTNESQVYSSASKDIALSSPPPEGTSLEDKRILFITYQPDDEILSVHPLPQEEVLNAAIKQKPTKPPKGSELEEESDPET